MMRAGKDYLTKAIPEYEDRRSAHLRELVGTIAAQNMQAEPEKTEQPVEAVEEPKPVNQAKPTLKLR